MIDIVKEIDIETSPQKVLDFITIAENHPKFLLPIFNIQGPPGHLTDVGQEWTWVFMMGGFKIPGRCSVAEYIPGEKYKYFTHGEFEGSFTYTVHPIKNGTHLKIHVQYTYPESLIGKVVSELFIKNINEKVAEQAIINLEAILSENAYREQLIKKV